MLVAAREDRALRRSPTRRSQPNYSALTVPTRWVKSVVALFLSAAVRDPHADVLHRLHAGDRHTSGFWAAEEFWFFSLGVVLWLIAFFGLPRPLLVYVFGHELTHAVWVWLMGGRVSQFRVSRDGGHIITDRNNFWIALAPYFFPLYSIIAIATLRRAQLSPSMCSRTADCFTRSSV